MSVTGKDVEVIAFSREGYVDIKVRIVKRLHLFASPEISALLTPKSVVFILEMIRYYPVKSYLFGYGGWIFPKCIGYTLECTSYIQF